MRLSKLRQLLDDAPGEIDASDASYHRLAPLLVDSSAVGLRDSVVAEAVRLTAVDMAQFGALQRVLEALRPHDVLVIKGAAFGATLYDSTSHRPRADVDLWLRGWDAVEDAARRVEELGFERVHALPGRLVPHAVALRGPHGVMLDLHARCSRRHRVARALDFQMAWADRMTAVANGLRMEVPSARFAFIHASMHAAAHHADQRLPAIMLEDLRRLAYRLGPADWRWIWSIVAQAELVTALATAIASLRQWDRDAVPKELAAACASAGADASVRFTDPTLAMLDDLDVLDADLALEFLREALLPPREYLLRHYGIATDRPVGVLRAYRVASSVADWLGG